MTHQDVPKKVDVFAKNISELENLVRHEAEKHKSTETMARCYLLTVHKCADARACRGFKTAAARGGSLWVYVNLRQSTLRAVMDCINAQEHREKLGLPPLPYGELNDGAIASGRLPTPTEADWAAYKENLKGN